MNSTRWAFLVILVIFVGISWGVRVLLSQRVTDRVLDEDGDKEE